MSIILQLMMCLVGISTAQMAWGYCQKKRAVKVTSYLGRQSRLLVAVDLVVAIAVLVKLMRVVRAVVDSLVFSAKYFVVAANVQLIGSFTAQCA
jgi:hypothetical protein